MKFYKNKFREKLENKGLTQSTIQSYVNVLEKYEDFINQKKNHIDNKENHIAYLYLKQLNKNHSKNSTLYSYTYPVKLYYDLFRKENPFQFVHFRRNEESIKDNTFTKEELDEIFDNYSQETTTQIRNKVLLSLYIYQGIRTKEIQSILINDINFTKYNIHLKGDNRTNTRKIELNIKQIILLNDYINIHREILRNNKKEERLIITSKQSNRIDIIVYRLTQKLKKEIYGFENFNQIRKSVIKNWLNNYDLRTVQYLCGHKYISSTEKFITKDIEELSKEINQFFPLNH